VDIKGRKSHRIGQGSQQARIVEILKNLDHRGACGCEVNTGDGAGILMQMPHAFLKRCAEGAHPAARARPVRLRHHLPAAQPDGRRLEERFEQVVQSEGQHVLGWRTVPTNNAMLGETAKACEPFIRRCSSAATGDLPTTSPSSASCTSSASAPTARSAPRRLDGAEYWYVVQPVVKTLVYKGMLLTTQLDQYFPTCRTR
jgi:glutamate synthase domain-containing protein 1